MRLTSEDALATELRDPEIRQHTVESQIRIGVPFQLRAMREKRGWTQETLAEKLGTTQNTVSRLENPRTSKPTITTLLRVASAFDVGLLVRFVPFGFYGDVIEAMNPTHIEIPSYEEELKDEIAALAEIDTKQAVNIEQGYARPQERALADWPFHREAVTQKQPVPILEMTGLTTAFDDDFPVPRKDPNLALTQHCACTTLRVTADDKRLGATSTYLPSFLMDPCLGAYLNDQRV